jgi:hypothetical protein
MMTIELISIDSLSLDPGNARKHGKRNLETIQASLRRFGQQKPIVVDSHNVVRAGSGTLEAARALGWESIQVVRSDLPMAELTAFAIVDNRTAELAEWDGDVLARLTCDGELGDVGFSAEEMEKLCGQIVEPNAGEKPALKEAFEVVIECRDEQEQKQMFERLSSEGFSCRLFTL